MNDYLCLGITVPEVSAKYGLRVCSAGMSLKNMELIRVYPMTVEQHFCRWHYSNNVALVRNPKDNRKESWKIDCFDQSFIQIPRYEYAQSRRKKVVAHMYDKAQIKSIEQLNEERLSLAIVKLRNPKGYFVNQSKIQKLPEQLSLFNDVQSSGVLTKEGFEFLPRIEWKDEEGKKHDLWYNSWDAYMHQLKLSPKYGVGNLWEASNLHDGQFALIGNMNSQRNAWLIISLF